MFNSGAFEYAQDRTVKADNLVYLEHGKPLTFAKGKKGVRLNNLKPEVVELGKGVSEDDLLFHDEKADDPAAAFLLARMRRPEHPEPVGVLRAVEKPTYDAGVNAQIQAATAKQGEGDLDALFNSGDTWVVE